MPNRRRIAAEDIAQAILDVTGDALLSGDFESFASVFHVPQTMATIAGPVEMETLADMRRAFDDMHKHFKTSGVDELRRSVVKADFETGDRISSTHISETYANGTLVKGPYPVFSTIGRFDGTWKVTHSEYGLEASSQQAQAIARADRSARAQAK